MITRSGRKIKKPELFQPTESEFVDDFSPEEYDTDEESGTDVESESESESDAGSLEDFIVDDDDA
jgi:hypothetical protein|uniref:Uncharacterized protein n=1 Tax=Mantoniella tinhauana virus 1 TaxID=3111543 RepID=A0AB38ZME0_9VIRU